VVECGGDLNEGLEEALFGLGEGEPHTFPVLVSLEELLGAITLEAMG